MTYYDRGRDASLKMGDTINAALARINVAEILTDRGEWAEAEALLLDTLPSGRPLDIATTSPLRLSLLARRSLRTGRLDQALGQLEHAKSNYLAVGAEREVPALDARIAECQLCKGDVDVALAVVTGMLSRRDAGSRAYPAALLHRVRALALSRKGESAGARVLLLEASISAARNARDVFELTLALHALVELDRQWGREPAADVVTEIGSLMARLGFGRFRPRWSPPGRSGPRPQAASAASWHERSGPLAASHNVVDALVACPSHGGCRSR